ncbi:SMI1/KNR4 family protein [Dokdonia sp. 4H-3-7-5]|uniref:SMI1/KNR4 family protein n=1 Tax=Dokdonia sp. (strain 4H-3-7-5) TaxID=983548 RepID=UPI00020A72BD|nr:SMI1/KNR4 family protein [Dokdonia sp. 4H-3-7-5]AEE18111.1 Cell wall assembly/cell proliferation coordinating protein, KNR4-like protein [Dokdonia sp. 4H-3-7-5]
MKDLKICKDELDISNAEIEKAEKIWNTKFPLEYKEFLLENNGGISYPNWPTIPSENNSELWGIERFLSIGDVILQKQYPMTYTLNDIDQEDFEPHNLNKDLLLVFALGERGIYFFHLSENDFGQIYFANYSGGDGIVKVKTKSFKEFLNSLDLWEWSDEEYNPNFKFEKPYCTENKIIQTHLFHTPNNPELGFNRFKEVVEVLCNVQPEEIKNANIPHKYINDISKIEHLIKKGCNTDVLLSSARKSKIIKYLIEQKGLDINKTYKGRYPLQNYLTVGSPNDAKVKYQLLSELLELKIEMDWSVTGNKYDGTPDFPMIEKLKILNEKYLQYEIDEKNWWIKNGKPTGHIPYPKSSFIEKKLGNTNIKTDS